MTDIEKLRNGVGNYLIGKKELANDVLVAGRLKADDDAITDNVKSLAKGWHADGFDVIGGVEIVKRNLLARERDGGTGITESVVKIQLGAADTPRA